MIAALCILGYVACAVAAGYLVGTLRIGDGEDRVFATIACSFLGPLGLTIAVAFIASHAGLRHAELRSARHRAALAEMAAAEREIAKVLGGEVRR